MTILEVPGAEMGGAEAEGKLGERRRGDMVEKGGCEQWEEEDWKTRRRLGTAEAGCVVDWVGSKVGGGGARMGGVIVWGDEGLRGAAEGGEVGWVGGMKSGEGIGDLVRTGVEGLRAVRDWVGLEGVRYKGEKEGEGKVWREREEMGEVLTARFEEWGEATAENGFGWVEGMMGGEEGEMDDVEGANGEGLGVVRVWLGMARVSCEGVEERDGWVAAGTAFWSGVGRAACL